MSGIIMCNIVGGNKPADYCGNGGNAGKKDIQPGGLLPYRSFGRRTNISKKTDMVNRAMVKCTNLG